MRAQVYVAWGERTRIRPFSRSDVDRWQAWPDHPDPLYAAHNPRRMPGPLRDTWYRDLVERQRQVPYAVDGLTVLTIGRIFLRHLQPDLGTAVLGIDFHPGYVGQGYGSEALRHFLGYYFFELGFGRMLLSVAAYNERARRAYLGCGFQSLGRYWDRHDPRVRPHLCASRYDSVRRFFRANGGRLEAQFEDMLLTRERFQEVGGRAYAPAARRTGMRM